MRFTSLALALAGSAGVAVADCGSYTAYPDDGEIALYRNYNCHGKYSNVAAMNTCVSDVGFDACSAITRKGVTCDIYKSNDCDGGYIATIDSDGYRYFCGWIVDTVKSVRCRSA
jgi:hypothetical protein